MAKKYKVLVTKEVRVDDPELKAKRNFPAGWSGLVCKKVLDQIKAKKAGGEDNSVATKSEQEQAIKDVAENKATEIVAAAETKATEITDAAETKATEITDAAETKGDRDYGCC